MERKQYTPSKLSKFTNITNANISSNKGNSDYNKQNLDYSKANLDYSKSGMDYSKVNTDYGQKPNPTNDVNMLKDYQILKLQVKQLEGQNRQINNDIQKLRYEKNIHENKYHQKISYEEETIAQFQKEKNYQMELMKIKNDEELNKAKRQFDLKIDELHRELRSKDYHNRQFSQKKSYLELKANELKKRIENLQNQLVRSRQTTNVLNEHLNKEQFTKKKLITITEQLQRQKCEMEAEIHVLLDIQAQKSRSINTLEIQLRNSESTERALHQKLTILSDNFANLEEHITIMKERLISTDLRNEQLQNQLQNNELQLSEKDSCVALQKQYEIRLRKDLQSQQQRQNRRQKQISQLISENQRLLYQINSNKQHLHDLCISQGIEV